jgi:hypothetical protein
LSSSFQRSGGDYSGSQLGGSAYQFGGGYRDRSQFGEMTFSFRPLEGTQQNPIEVNDSPAPAAVNTGNLFGASRKSKGTFWCGPKYMDNVMKRGVPADIPGITKGPVPVIDKQTGGLLTIVEPERLAEHKEKKRKK